VSNGLNAYSLPCLKLRQCFGMFVISLCCGCRMFSATPVVEAWLPLVGVFMFYMSAIFVLDYVEYPQLVCFTMLRQPSECRCGLLKFSLTYVWLSSLLLQLCHYFGCGMVKLLHDQTPIAWQSLRRFWTGIEDLYLWLLSQEFQYRVKWALVRDTI